MLQLAPPYSQFAPVYDQALGRASLQRTCAAFETLARVHHIRFRAAADLGCGTGLFARYLAKRWNVPVIGVDRSPAMLAVARRRCRGLPVTLLRQSIEQLRLARTVELVTAHHDTLNHLLTEKSFSDACRQVAGALAPGGWFYFDLLTPNQPWPSDRWITRRGVAGGLAVEQHIRAAPRERQLFVRIVLRRADPAAPVVEQHRERLFAPCAVAGWLRRCGLEPYGIHDAATLKLTNACPPRVIFVARRKIA